MLELQGVTVAASQKRAANILQDISLRVGSTETVALLGPSGCGKSTLLRAIAGLQPLAEGRVFWDGEDITAVKPHRRGFGLLFQDGQLFNHKNVAENIGYGLRLQKRSRSEVAERVEQLLDLVGLAGYGKRSVLQLSGGQQQRVALARALAPAPKLLLLDEPLSALDADLRTRLAQELTVMLENTAAIFVTHDETEASAVADRIIRMRDGRLAG